MALFKPSRTDLVFHLTISDEGVFCCHLVRIPWSLIQFKETARLLYATAARKQERFMFYCQSQQPSLVQFQKEFHHAAAADLCIDLLLMCPLPFNSSAGA